VYDLCSAGSSVFDDQNAGCSLTIYKLEGVKEHRESMQQCKEKDCPRDSDENREILKSP